MNITKSTVEAYKIRDGEYGTWADITIDAHEETGRISISSGRGDWAYYWGSCGCNFKEFLCGLNIGYVAGKFGEDRYFLHDETFASWKKYVLELRKADDMSAKDARELWDEIQQIENVGYDEKGVEHVVWESEHILPAFGSPEMITDISPSFRFFWDNQWQFFIQELKKELAETDTPVLAE